jgi:hypothetical protein
MGLCRMFNRATRGQRPPKYLNADHDPRYGFHQWQANLRILTVKEIRTAPYVVLTVLNMLLKKAVEWEAIDRMPCTIRPLPIPKPSAGFYDFDEYEQLVDAAKSTGPNADLIVLLGGDAGLRCGE